MTFRWCVHAGRNAGASLLLAAAVASPLACDEGQSVSRSDAGASNAGSGGNTGAAGAGNPPPGGATGPQCNGAAALCDVSYSSLSFLGTHLSMASSKAWATQTQGRSLLDQLLVGGVRVLELEIHDDHGALSLCAGACANGNHSFSSTLRDIVRFLNDNPRDVLTLVLRSTVLAEALLPTFESEGVVVLAHRQEQGLAWPTLRELGDAKKRVIVFIEQLPADESASPSGGGSDSSSGSAGTSASSSAAGNGTSSPAPLPTWLHPLGDWAWETAPDEATNCVIARGDGSRPFAILNHYVSGEAADDEALIAAHDPDVLAARLRRCQDDRGRRSNFVFVNFAEVGDPNGGTQIANGLR